ncbi:MAG: DeoR/GlpR transcriptional regulator [Sedimentisphaerales bacterium]|nr:DeoR/GlpR transcriptional regulator [Sedimentisphaerales bacterium]
MSRDQHILDHVNRRGKATYKELAQSLKVSTMTIRRDIDKMAEKHLVMKTLRGVRRMPEGERGLLEAALAQRLSERIEEKRAIARQALTIVRDGQTIFLDGSTTCAELAGFLGKQHRGLTVITNSLLIGQRLRRDRDSVLMMIGGRFDRDTYCFVGPSAEDQISRYFVDISFMSTRAFMPTEGTYESSVDSYRIKQGVVAQSRRTVLLADHSKFGHRALTRVLDVAQIDTVITDAGISGEYVTALQQRNINVEVSPLEESVGIVDSVL